MEVGADWGGGACVVLATMAQPTQLLFCGTYCACKKPNSFVFSTSSSKEVSGHGDADAPPPRRRLPKYENRLPYSIAFLLTVQQVISLP